MKMKEESVSAGLKLNIWKTKIMAPGPTTAWPIEGEKMEVMTDVLFLGSKITADGDWNHEIKICSPWKEGYDKRRQSVKK